MSVDVEEVNRLFEEASEGKVREALASGRYSTRKAAFAKLWLDNIDAARQERSMRESNQTAKSAKNAAWIAAIAAIIAAVFAVMAFFLPSS